MNQFDYEEEGLALTKKALSILEKPLEIQKDDPFTVNASLATEFIIIRCMKDYKNGAGVKFQPDHTHQFFRESNEIYGYKNLKLQIFVTSIGLIPLVKYTYDEVCEDADDIEANLTKLYEAGFLKESQEEQFLRILEEEQNKIPVGEHITSYESRGLEYQIFMSSMNTKSFAEYKPYLQAFLFLLIDGATFPCDSPEWIYLTVYEKTQDGYNFLGLGTLYEFYISASVVRHRISQLCFLPNYQRQGHGGQLLRAMYKNSLADEKCKQITLEDPSEDFQVMRDITDTKMLIEHFRDIVDSKTINNVKQLQSLELEKPHLRKLMKQTKLFSQQIKRVHQIILYARINKYNMKIKKRNDKSIMREYCQIVIHNLRSQFKPYDRVRNPLVIFENGENLNTHQMHFLEQSERMQKQNINYEELFMEEISFYEIITQKLKKDGVL